MENYNDMELEDLYRTRESVEIRIDNYFGEDEGHTGDQGYQELLEDLGNIQDAINVIIDYEE